MTRISGSVFVLKRVFPLAWFGFLILFGGIALLATITRGPQPGDVFFLAVPTIMAIVGYMMFKHLVWPLADEVYDDGDYLVVIKSGEEARIALTDIMNVSAAPYMNPPLVTLRLIQPSRFGSEISFSPIRPFTLNPFAKNEAAENLILRVHQARSGRGV